MGESPLAGSGAARSNEITLLELTAVLLRRWRLLVGLPLAATVVAVAIALVMPPTFTATATFVPERSSNTRLPAGLAGIAGEFGISIGSEGSRSPRFFADVLKSREILERLLQSTFADPRTREPNDSTQLLSILKVRGRSTADSLSNGVRALGNLIGTRVDAQTDIVRLTVESRYAETAAATSNRLVAYLNEFNTHTRQSQAGQRRRFVEARIAEAEHELRAAEADLRNFYERNRTWQQSPQLTFDEGRLRRQVEIRQEVYLTLKREFETARIEEVNDTPVITVIDPAVTPSRPSWPRLPVVGLLAVVLGGLASVLWAFAAHFLEGARVHDRTAYEEIAKLFGVSSRDRG